MTDDESEITVIRRAKDPVRYSSLEHLIVLAVVVAVFVTAWCVFVEWCITDDACMTERVEHMNADARTRS